MYIELYTASITNYSIVWFNPTTQATFVETNTNISPFLENGVWIATVTTALGCIDTLIVNVNSSLIFGCMDGHAINYSPAATVPIQYWTSLYVDAEFSSEACEYQVTPSRCIPPEIGLIDDKINACLSTLTTSYLTNLRAGMNKNCKDKDVRLIHLIQYLFSRRGLECLYNCSDSLSPTNSEVSCASLWQSGGPSGTSLLFDPTVTYQNGDVVLHESGNYYTYTVDCSFAKP